MPAVFLRVNISIFWPSGSERFKARAVALNPAGELGAHPRRLCSTSPLFVSPVVSNDFLNNNASMCVRRTHDKDAYPFPTGLISVSSPALQRNLQYRAVLPCFVVDGAKTNRQSHSYRFHTSLPPSLPRSLRRMLLFTWKLRNDESNFLVSFRQRYLLFPSSLLLSQPLLFMTIFSHFVCACVCFQGEDKVDEPNGFALRGQKLPRPAPKKANQD